MASVFPPTTTYPPDPTGLERGELEKFYLGLRDNYKSLMRSRGQFRGQAQKARSETDLLKQRLIALATKEASVRKDVYEMLDIVSSVAGELEDAGDDLKVAYEGYRVGRRSYQGGGYLGGLLQAVIRFHNRWTTTKQLFRELTAKQAVVIEQLGSEPYEAPPAPIQIEISIEDEADGRNR